MKMAFFTTAGFILYGKAIDIEAFLVKYNSDTNKNTNDCWLYPPDATSRYRP